MKATKKSPKPRVRRRPRIKIIKSASTTPQWYYIVVAMNGKTLVVSEMFPSRTIALKGARALVKICQTKVMPEDLR